MNQEKQINGLGETHPNSPSLGDIVYCTDTSRKLNDSGGYRVESLGWSLGYGTKYGYFTARGVTCGGLYGFSVDEWKPKN